MKIDDISIAGYRSVHSMKFPLRQLTVLVGKNGVGKTNIYRALELMQAAANGNCSRELAKEGGISSAFWAGKLRKHEKRHIQLAVQFDALEEFGTHKTLLEPKYEFNIGFPPSEASASFPLEAEFKTETVSMKVGNKSAPMMRRKALFVDARGPSGRMEQVEADLLPSEAALFELGSAASYSELAHVRNAISRWRFYHKFRTDSESALRNHCAAVTAPMLDSNGHNLAAVFATLRYIRNDTVDLDQAIDEAFPGAKLSIPIPEQFADFGLVYPNFPKRTFYANELSDGTLQYLALVGALLGYRLPKFMALNEPETSLHPSVLPALGKLIANAAARTQVLVVTHSTVLADAIEEHSGVAPIQVVKQENGATWLEGLNKFGWFAED